MPWQRLIDVAGNSKIQIMVFDIRNSGNEIVLRSQLLLSVVLKCEEKNMTLLFFSGSYYQTWK